MGMTHRKGQRLRPLHPALAEREWGLRGDSVGTVLCSYRARGPIAEPVERVDILFASRVVWGAPATEFAPVAEGKS